MDWDPKSTETHGYICPPCPVFHPTAAEFKNPLKYISSIRHIGEQAGICKIVPPAGWRPPFAINDKTFRFRTRVQQLNCIDGHSRAEGNFVESLRMFLYRSGAPMKELPRVHGQLVNLRLLYRTVQELGGYARVCAAQLWPQIVRRVGRTRSADAPDAELCAAYEHHYVTSLLAFERHEAVATAASNSSTFQTPDGSKRSRMNSNNSTTESTDSTVAATPQSKTRSSMKKATQQQQLVVDIATDIATDSPLVKRTLFTEHNGHTSSEENDASSVYSVDTNATTTTTRPNDSSSSSSHKQRATRHHPKHELPTTTDDEMPSMKSSSTSNKSPLTLKPDPKRSHRLDAPAIVVGQQFYQFFPDCGAVLAQVKRVVTTGKKPHVVIQFASDNSRDSLDVATVQILIANGWDPDAAELAYKSEICQTCLRGDCSEKMLLCDGCNCGHHLFCLEPPLVTVPTGDWYCAACVDEAESASDTRDVTTNPKFGFEMGSEYSVTTYKSKADAWKRTYFGTDSDHETSSLSDLEIEREYWRLLSIPVHEQRLEVEYGSDIDSGAVGSGFPRLDVDTKCLRVVAKRLRNVQNATSLDAFFAHGLDNLPPDASASEVEAMLRLYARDSWNLNNLPKLHGSVLQHLDEDIKGVMVPWIYMGMCFSTFCWHVEDHNFYSMSYNHCGAAKTWYGVPSHSATLFETTMQQLTPELFGAQPDLHLQLVTMFSPATLRQHNVPVYRATHRPNEFMVTFPSAYHGGFNNGFNCAEAVNFATIDWLPFGAASVRKYRTFHKLPVFSHDALVCSLVETLVDAVAFDVKAAKAFVRPALQQLLQEFVAFEARVAAQHVTTHEWMASFEERYQSAALPVRAAKKRTMATSECDDVENSNRMGGKMMATATTRMVLWAGPSGKHDGLRCVTCKQYCYLQAVVCTKCRLHNAVGCSDHFATMCSCDAATHYVYVHRFDVAHIVGLLAAVDKRLEAVDAWDAAFDSAFLGNTDEKPSVAALYALRTAGKQCGGAAQARFEAIDAAIDSAMHWTKQAMLLVQQTHKTSRTDKSNSTKQLHAALALLDAAASLVAVPDQFDAIEQLVATWRACQRTAAALLDAVQAIQRIEATTAFDLHDVQSAQLLWHASKQHQATIAALGDVVEQLDALDVERNDATRTQLVHARQYLEVLVSANAVLTMVAKRIARRSDVPSSRPLSPTSAPVSVTACRLVVTSADNLALDVSQQITKVDVLRSLLQTAEVDDDALTSALADHSKSTEELRVLLTRLQHQPIVPDALSELADRLQKCDTWEQRAVALIALQEPFATRPTVADAERFYNQADEWHVPTTSRLRRQVHARLQDCRRWSVALHNAFLKPATIEPATSTGDGSAVTTFLTAAIRTFHAAAAAATTGNSDDVPPHAASQLHCVCEQVMRDMSDAVTCEQCGAFFHAQCIEYPPDNHDHHHHHHRHRAASASTAAIRPKTNARSGGAATPTPHRYTCRNCQPTFKRSTAGNGNARHLNRSSAASSSSTSPSTTTSSSTTSLDSLHLRATLGSTGVPLFCHCRGPEGSSMICCDFCDEWYHAACINMSIDTMTQVEAFRCERCAIKQGLYYLDRRAIKRDVVGRRPALGRIDALVTTLESALIAVPPGAIELLTYRSLAMQLDAEVAIYSQQFAAALTSSHTLAQLTLDYAAAEAQTLAWMHRVTACEVALDVAQGRVGAIHWCLRACRMVLACERAPKYAHLVVLLEDVQQPHFSIPCVAVAHIQRTIDERVTRAARWLKQTKSLEVEEWNVEKARRLLRELDELSQFLELPVAEVNLVQQIVANANNQHDDDDESGDDEYVETAYDHNGGGGGDKRQRLR